MVDEAPAIEPPVSLRRIPLRTNLWLLPLLLSVATVGLFALTRALDRLVESGDFWLPSWLVARSIDDAQVLLAALLGVNGTVIAFVFSTTMVTITLASSQLGPRLIRRFMRDRATQATIGIFMSAFLFTLLTLASLRSDLGDEGVPLVSMAVAEVVTLLAFGSLIYYVHHVASTVQVPSVVAGVAGDVRRSIRERMSQLERIVPPWEKDDVDVARALVEADGVIVVAPESGYVQAIDHDRVLVAAQRHGAVVQFHHRPGQFVIRGDALATVSPAAAGAAVAPVIGRRTYIGNNRTISQDIEFAIAQVVEICLRALSPAINDTFTALTCIDWLGAGLTSIARMRASTGGYRALDGKVRLVEPVVRFDRVVKTAFDLIRQSGQYSPAVQIRLLHTFRLMAPALDAEHRPALLAQAELVRHAAERANLAPGDLADVIKAHGRALRALEGDDEESLGKD
ncbi:MAG TPA: DUF2254 domain-containing protein [Acidimicrobiales bacterium]